MTTFSTASRARLRHATAGPQLGYSAGGASWPSGKARTETGNTTRPDCGGKRGSVRPGASAVARPLSRGGAAEPAPPTLGDRPRHRSAGGDPPLRGFRHRHAQQRRPVALSPTRLTPSKCHSERLLLPLDPARDYPGGGQAPSRALPSVASVASQPRTLDRAWPRAPGPLRRLSGQGCDATHRESIDAAGWVSRAG